MRLIIMIIVAVVLGSSSYAMDFSQEEKRGIEGLEITYERAFNHNHDGLTIMMDITNNTGYDIQLDEVIELNADVEGYKLNHQNSYSLNGGTLENGETKKNFTLLYFHEEHETYSVGWAIPEFIVTMNGEEYHIEGKKQEMEY